MKDKPRQGGGRGGARGDETKGTSAAAGWETPHPATLPSLCNLTQLPLGSAMSRHDLAPHQLVYQGRLYSFDSEISQWCFEQDPERYAGHHTVVDRFIAGQIVPPDLSGGLVYMGITPDVMGDDVYNYAWARDYPASGA